MGADDKNPVADRFGVNLRRCRHKAGLSQEALSFRASIHRTEVGLLERGKREPRLGTIVKLARSLSVPPADLLSGISWNPDGPDGGGFDPAPSDDAISRYRSDGRAEPHDLARQAGAPMS